MTTPGHKLAGAYAEGVAEGIWRTAEDLLSRSVQGAPVDEGTLRASATVEVTVNGTPYRDMRSAKDAARRAAEAGGQVKVIGQVAFNTPYAARQHEELGNHHPKGGEAKYLERPLVEQADRYGRIVRQSAEVSLRKARP